MISLSAVIISAAENEDIERCHRSLLWADDIVLAVWMKDGETCETPPPDSVRIVHVKGRDWVAVRETIIDSTLHPWVLLVKADEEISPALAGEIQGLDIAHSPLAGYYIPRVARYLNRLIYHCGWGSDPVLRLFHRDRGVTVNFDATESVLRELPLGNCRNCIQHYPYRDIEDHLDRTNASSDMLASQMYRKGRGIATPSIFLRAAMKFVSTYFFHLGFLDGYPGFVISILDSYRIFLSYSKLLENRENARGDVS